MGKNKFNQETLMLVFLVLVVIAGFMIFGYRIFNPNEGNQAKKVKVDQINEVKADPGDPQIITTDELKEKIDQNEDIVMVDIQSIENYLTKHIPNSISIPRDELTNRYKELSNDKEIIIMGAGKDIDKCNQCTQAAKTLISLGLTNVKDFKEGIAGWEAKGYPTVTGQDVTFKNIDADKLKQKIDDREDIMIIDIRDEEEYNIEHIKSATHIDFSSILSKKEELSNDKMIIIYDTVGHRSKLVTENLVKEGVLTATNLLDGFKGWKEKDYPVEN